MAIGSNGISDFHELRRQLGQKHPRLLYQVFDLLWLDGEDPRSRGSYDETPSRVMPPAI